jgi:hypothetical protein
LEEFTATQRKVIEWLALPKSNRKPKTQIQLGAAIGVSDETISIWKRDPKFKQAVWALIEDLAGDDDADIIAAIKRNARRTGRDGVNDRKLYLQWRGQLVEKQEDVTKDRELVVRVIRVNASSRLDNTGVAPSSE